MAFLIFIEGVLGLAMIKDYCFGHMVINDKTYSHDVVITKNKVYSSWWRKEGHKVDWDDLSSFLKEKIEIVVIGTGAYGLMKPTLLLQEKLKEMGIEMVALPTKDAVKIFNEQYHQEKAVLGAFHQEL
jgi:hypothetical protein